MKFIENAVWFEPDYGIINVKYRLSVDGLVFTAIVVKLGKCFCCSVKLGKQLSQLSVALKKPEVAYSISWFAASYDVLPALTRIMFSYQTQYLIVDSSLLGISKVFGKAVMLLWSIVYNRHLNTVPARKLIAVIQQQWQR